MYKVLLFFLMSGLLVTSCKEDNNGKSCYECREIDGTDNYLDAGCYTDAEWNVTTIHDNYGDELDKATHCRKK